ncbi:hypothetical protein ADL00_10405 [Streptomyces sp. AS58]|nr:hypothetical protein ADL00_10405 [Streptomyces sp. AS58]
MRILLSATPIRGHILPLIPLARAFRLRGDSVALMGAESAASIIAGEDIEFLRAGAGVEVSVAEVLRTTGHDLFKGVTLETEAEFFAGARVDLTIEEAVAAARAWEPDLIVSEHLDFVGPLTGAILGVPVANLAYGPVLAAQSIEETTARVSKRYESRGLQYEAARWYLDTCPPALQRPGWVAPENWIGIQPQAHRAAGQVPPARVERGEGRPRVLVTAGTSYAAPEVVSPLLRELLKQDIDVRVTLNRASAEDFDVDVAAVGGLEFVGFTPLAELLRDVDVVVTHGGAGTVLGALAEGLPMVVVPQGADQPVQAERVGAAGAGIAFPMGEAPPQKVADAVRTVLAEPSYRTVAEKIAAEIADYNTPAEVAERLASAISR